MITNENLRSIESAFGVKVKCLWTSFEGRKLEIVSADPEDRSLNFEFYFKNSDDDAFSDATYHIGSRIAAIKANARH